ncbi:MAG: hypothetical protein IPH96_00550 [Saprospiraceae bacterium]|nr:hypothetical protein [Saprospiraceae bacterium]
MNDLIKIILAVIPATILVFLAGLALGAELYPKIKIIFSDILSLFGWAGKRVRKYSVEQEYQGTINSIIQDYNKNFENPILPNCKIEWVTAENQRNILKRRSNHLFEL